MAQAKNTLHFLIIEKNKGGFPKSVRSLSQHDFGSLLDKALIEGTRLVIVREEVPHNGSRRKTHRISLDLNGSSPVAIKDSLLMHNLKSLCEKTRAVIKSHLAAGRLEPQDSNTLSAVRGWCTEEFELAPSDFRTTKGEPMSAGPAFKIMLHEFFSDAVLIKQLVRQAREELKHSRPHVRIAKKGN